MRPLGPTEKRALRIAGWIALGLFSFVFALQATFPYQRIADKAVEALSPRYDVTIASVERGWLPGKMILNGVTLRSRPEKPEDVVSTMFFKRVEIDVNLLSSLLGLKLDTDLDVYFGSGHMGGNIAIGKKEVSVSISGEDVPASDVPGLTDAVGLPMTGKMDPLFELDLPKNDWRQATGRLKLVCPKGCTVGDGKSKLKFKVKAGSRQAAFASEGVTIDKMFVDRFALQVDIAKGKLQVTTFELKSGDLEATLDLKVQLARSMAESTVSTGCLRYKPSPTLLDRAPHTHAALLSTGAPLGPDGYYHILLSGRLAEMKRLPRVCQGQGAVTAEDGGRPSLRGLSDVPAASPPPMSPTAPAEPLPGKPDDVAPTTPPPD